MRNLHFNTARLKGCATSKLTSYSIILKTCQMKINTKSWFPS